MRNARGRGWWPVIKALSLVIIIIMLAACVFALFGDALTEPFVRSDANIRDYAFTVDQLGNIFFIRNDKDNRSLIALDSTGGEVLRTDIAEYFDEHFFVESVYVLQNKNIWVTGYEYDPDTLTIDNVRIAAFREDGSFVEDIYYGQVSVFKDNLYRRISSFDEDERCVYFAIRGIVGGENTLSAYVYVKDGSEPLRKIDEYTPDDRTGLAEGAAIVAFHALPGGGIVASYTDGTLEMHASRGREVLADSQFDGIRVTRFWSGAGVVYMYDAVSGTVYSTPHNQLRPVPVISGSFASQAGAGVRVRDMHDLSVSGVGNVLGVIHTETGSDLYMGGFTFLPHIASLSRIKSADITDWLIAVAVVAGILIVSVLIWEFFVQFMHMRMSMIIRYALLTTLVVFIAFFVLSKYALVPSVSDSLGEAYRNSLSSDADVLLTSMKTSVSTGGASLEAYMDFMEGFGNRYNTEGMGSGPLFAYLISYSDGAYKLIASSNRHPGGITLSAFLPYAGIEDEIRAVRGNDGRFITIETETGRQLALIKRAGIVVGSAETFLCVIQNLSTMEGSIRSFASLLNTYLLISGIVLAVLLIITVVFHVITLKRLSRILHLFALGSYDINADIHSGDETGEMFRHIRRLSGVLREKDAGLNTLSTLYHRFIPQRFLKLLGEVRVENVTKNMQTRIEGAYTVFVRFNITGGSAADIFKNANDVLEHIVPVVAQYGGTVYGFTNNGFDGVFEGSATDALGAALSVRDTCRRWSAKLKAERDVRVDLRVVLAKDDLTLGFIGDENRMEPVAISDAAPIAEALARICFGSNIFIAVTEQFYADIKANEYRIRKIGKALIEDKGVDFYDIFDSDPPALGEVKTGFADKFELGVNLFAKGDYGNAGRMFMEIIKHSTEDGAARNYVYLCEYNSRNTDKRTYYTVIQTDN